MDESEHHSENEAKMPSQTLRDKEEMEAMLHHKKLHKVRHHKETHGMSDDIDEDTPINEVKGPSVFQRAKEELEAVVETIHSRSNSIENEAKLPNLPVRDKEEMEAMLHHKKLPKIRHHHKETHGMSGDIDVDTPINEVKGPSVFQRAKEELEAVVEAIHSRNDSMEVITSPKKESGFRASIARCFEKVCSPSASKRD